MNIWSPGATNDGTTTRREHRHVLSVVCALSKYVVSYAIPNQTSEAVIEVLVQKVFPMSWPRNRIRSDDSPALIAALMNDLFEGCGITLELIAPLSLQANGQIERFFMPLRTMLATLVHGMALQWDVYLPHVVYAYNTSYHRAIDNNPYFFIFGRDPIPPWKILRRNYGGMPPAQGRMVFAT